jgi:hypothetical protein
MPVRTHKHFILPYEPEYIAHRSDERVSRVTRLHLNVRNLASGPSIAPELEDEHRSYSADELEVSQRGCSG